MIFDSVKNACLYLGLNPRLDTALRFLADGKFAEQAAGRYVLQENDITCSRFTAETHLWEEGFFESHRKFFDIHVPLSSKELLLTAPIERLVPDGDFDEAADCQKFHAQPATVLALTPGMFAVCFPGDGHMPLVCEEGRGHVEKWIFKVRI